MDISKRQQATVLAAIAAGQYNLPGGITTKVFGWPSWSRREWWPKDLK